jgi:hypothetical protein
VVVVAGEGEGGGGCLNVSFVVAALASPYALRPYAPRPYAPCAFFR